MTTDKPPTDHADDHGFDWHSRRSLAAGLVLVAVAAVWALTSGSDKNNTEQTTAYESACGLTGGSTATPTSSFDVQWQNVDGNWLPISSSQGPGRRSATEPWTCYAHTPTGAVLAAWGIPAAGWTSANFAAGVRAQTVPGVGQTALLKQGPGTTPANQRPTPVGFKLNSYDGQTATVTFFMRQRGSNVSCASTVEWAGGAAGDWKLRPTSDGSDMASCQLLPEELAGMDLVAWGPAS